MSWNQLAKANPSGGRGLLFQKKTTYFAGGTAFG
jgi:hypothetical protein